MSALERSTFAKMFEAAELCRQRALDVPMLVLVYTGIDALGWALYGDRVTEVRRHFILFCETHLLPGSQIQCTALELYAARCSILHTLGWKSELSRSGKARSVFYSFGADDPTFAQAALELHHPGKFISLKADDLLIAVRGAVETVTALATTDIEIARRLAVAASKQYRSLETGDGDKVFEAFIQKMQRDKRI